jgi:hypothetical protein
MYEQIKAKTPRILNAGITGTNRTIREGASNFHHKNTMTTYRLAFRDEEGILSEHVSPDFPGDIGKDFLIDGILHTLQGNVIPSTIDGKYGARCALLQAWLNLNFQRVDDMVLVDEKGKALDISLLKIETQSKENDNEAGS